MVNHHPAPELLASFTAGTLSTSYSLCVSAHLEYCHECPTNVLRLKTLGADLFDDLKPAPANDDFKDQIFETLTDDVQEVPVTHKTQNTDVPNCLSKVVPSGYENLNWRSFAPSIKSASLFSDSDNTHTSLLKILPGSKVGNHRHIGEEVTLVLKGSFSDEDGVYQKGDFLLRTSEETHQPTASSDGPCICLTAQEGPIQFTGFFSRMLNPILRMWF